MPRRKAGQPAAAGGPLFDIAALRAAAGAKIFARGVEYHQDGLVELIGLRTGHAVADVHGTDTYRTELFSRHGDITGSCTCPAIDEWGFCKHLVAVGLAANGVGTAGISEAAERDAGLRASLRAGGIEPLIDLILELAAEDRILRQRLELAAAPAAEDDEALLRRLKKTITEATRIREHLSYRDVRKWTRGVEQAVNPIERLVREKRADLALKVLAHFFERMDQAMLSLDDSDGHAGAAYGRACELHLEACRLAKPDPVGLANELFAREISAVWDFFHNAHETYGKMLGREGRAEYRRLAMQAWEALPPSSGNRTLVDETSGRRLTLKSILDSFALRDGDLELRIAIRAKDLSSPSAYHDLATLCSENGREDEALRWLEEGLRKFKSDPPQGLGTFAARIYRKRGRREDAAKLLWREFGRWPDQHRFSDIKRMLTSSPEEREAALDRAVAVLHARIQAGKEAPASMGDRSILVSLLTTEGRLDEAWAAKDRFDCYHWAAEQLAKASETSHAEKALQVYEAMAEQSVRSGVQSGYESGCERIRQIGRIRERLGQQGLHRAFLDAMRERHKAKRNFIKLLDALARS